MSVHTIKCRLVTLTQRATNSLTVEGFSVFTVFNTSAFRPLQEYLMRLLCDISTVLHTFSVFIRYS